VDVIFTTNGNCGVRPVITVSTSDLSNWNK
jgi:hypothetical protein